MDDLVNKRVRALAADHGLTVPETLAALDKHPIELDRDQFLRRTLALELIELDFPRLTGAACRVGGG